MLFVAYVLKKVIGRIMAGYIHLHLGRGLNHGINLKHAFSTFAFNNLGNITIHNPYGLIYKLPANMFLGY